MTKKAENSNPGGTALLIIDLQKKWFSTRYEGTKKGEEIAKRITSAVPAFRKAGWPIYVVRFFDLEMILTGAARLQEYKPDESDRKIWKFGDSVFTKSRISAYLKKDNVSSIAVCGGNLPCCVRVACEDGLKANYNVHLLRDLTGGSRHRTGSEYDIKDLERQGVHITDSDSILRSTGRTAVAIPSVR